MTIYVSTSPSSIIYLGAFREAVYHRLLAQDYSQFQIKETTFGEICSICHRKREPFKLIVRKCCICGKLLCSDCGAEIIYQDNYGMTCIEHIPQPWQTYILNHKDTNGRKSNRRYFEEEAVTKDEMYLSFP